MLIINKDVFRISDFISYGIHDKGVKHKWIAKKLGITEPTLSYKLKNDSFSICELLDLSILLDLDLGHIQELYKEFKKTKLEA